VFPYVEQPTFTVGSHTIYTFGLLAFGAVLTGVAIMVWRAPKIGFDREETLNLTTWMIVWGFVGSHVVSEIAYFPERVWRDPLVLLKLTGSMSSYGGIAGGMLAAAVMLRHQGKTKTDVFRFLDGVAFAFPFTWLFGRGGCALAHDHIGIRTTHWLAVRFPDGPRFDLGLLEFLYTIPIAALFLSLDRRPRPTGFFLALFFALYGPARFLMDRLRVEDARYLGWTPSQYVSIASAAVAIFALWRFGASTTADRSIDTPGGGPYSP
jgi:phosphatidylglycerol:prolipoprotein diacylglycerol transferase